MSFSVYLYLDSSNKRTINLVDAIGPSNETNTEFY